MAKNFRQQTTVKKSTIKRQKKKREIQGQNEDAIRKKLLKKNGLRYSR